MSPSVVKPPHLASTRSWMLMIIYIRKVIHRSQNWEDLARTAIGSRIGSENDPVNINDLDFNGALVKIEERRRSS